MGVNNSSGRRGKGRTQKAHSYRLLRAETKKTDWGEGKGDKERKLHGMHSYQEMKFRGTRSSRQEYFPTKAACWGVGLTMGYDWVL